MKNSIDNLYKKTSKESTPTALDNLILNQAKQSCEPKITKAKKPRRWMYSVATAAIFVMGFSVIINLQNINQDMQVAPAVIYKTETSETGSSFSGQRPPLEPHTSNLARARKDVSSMPTDTTMAIDESQITLKDTQTDDFSSAAYKINKNPTDNNGTEAKLNTEINTNKPAPAPVQLVKRKKLNFQKEIVGSIMNTDEPLNELPIQLSESEKTEFNNQKKDHDSESSDAVTNQNNLNHQNDNEERLEKIVVTGSRLKAQSNFSKNIELLEYLIENKNYKKAKKLLRKLKRQHTRYNFSEYDELLKHK